MLKVTQRVSKAHLMQGFAGVHGPYKMDRFGYKDALTPK